MMRQNFRAHYYVTCAKVSPLCPTLNAQNFDTNPISEE